MRRDLRKDQDVSTPGRVRKSEHRVHFTHASPLTSITFSLYFRIMQNDKEVDFGALLDQLRGLYRKVKSKIGAATMPKQEISTDW